MRAGKESGAVCEARDFSLDVWHVYASHVLNGRAEK